MSQRNSEYKRVKNDEYETPAWVVEALLPHIPPRVFKVFDPCCGSGNIIRAVESSGYLINAWGKDLERDGYDFLQDMSRHPAIVTNPPYGLAEEFIAHALLHSDLVAMLLRTDYDHAKTRRYLFADCREFSKIVRLTKRIVWIKRTDGKREAPSFNHSWFIWNASYRGSAPTVAWAPYE